VRGHKVINKAKGIFTFIMFVSHVATAARGGDPFIKEIIKHNQIQKIDIVLFGEQHGVPEFKQFFYSSIEKLAQSTYQADCLFLESDSRANAYIDLYMRGQLAADDVVLNSTKDLFTSWDLETLAPKNNWQNVIQQIASNSILDAKLLTIAKKHKIAIYAIDEINLTSFVTSTYNEVAATRGEEIAHKYILDSGLIDYLSDNPTMYYRENIIYKRNLIMSRAIEKKFKNGDCKKAIGIVGAMHAYRANPNGQRVYQKHRKPMNEILALSGLQATTVQMLLVPNITNAIGQHVQTLDLHYSVASRQTLPQFWGPSTDYDLSVIVADK
jgi:hypothetical protein